MKQIKTAGPDLGDEIRRVREHFVARNLDSDIIDVVVSPDYYQQLLQNKSNVNNPLYVLHRGPSRSWFKLVIEDDVKTYEFRHNETVIDTDEDALAQELHKRVDSELEKPPKKVLLRWVEGTETIRRHVAAAPPGKCVGMVFDSTLAVECEPYSGDLGEIIAVTIRREIETMESLEKKLFEENGVT